MIWDKFVLYSMEMPCFISTALPQGQAGTDTNSRQLEDWLSVPAVDATWEIGYLAPPLQSPSLRPLRLCGELNLRFNDPQAIAPNPQAKAPDSQAIAPDSQAKGTESQAKPARFRRFARLSRSCMNSVRKNAEECLRFAFEVCSQYGCLSGEWFELGKGSEQS